MATTHKQIEVQRFKAQSDTGKTYTIVEYQTITTFAPMSGPKTVKKGAKTLLLSNGETVEHVEGDVFKVFQTDELIRKVS